MKNRFLFTLLICLANILPMVAQQATSAKKYTFVYVAHEADTPVQQLARRLNSIYNVAIQEGDGVVFYMSNANNPIVVKVNFPDDNRGDFSNKLMAALQERNSHAIEGVYDVRKIIETMSGSDFLSVEGNLLYKTTNIDFYVTNSFWSHGYNESIIASLFFSLDVPRYISSGKDFHFNVYYPNSDPVHYNEGQPFGTRNVNSINQLVKLLAY